MSNKVRIEKDSMGEMEVPIDALYGASTMRAVLNFPISDLKFSREFIRALGLIKQSAAKANMDLGFLDIEIGKAIVEAAEEVIEGKLDQHFVLDIFQTGSGTSTNTNANEVIANRASQLMGGELGSRLVHPNDNVNLGQSSNDVIPTAIHVSSLIAIKEQLEPALNTLSKSLNDKSQEFWSVIKTGRTHLQDATPIRLGQEFSGFAGQIENGVVRVERIKEALSEVALGGTAVGTGVNTHPEFSSRVCKIVSEVAGISVRETSNHFQAQSTLDAAVEASGTLRAIATSLHKIANDIRFMACGPRAGIGEIILPEVQPGSSIMPGKINPVISESVIQVVAQIYGNDATVAVSGQGGYFELNTMMPVVAFNILQTISLLASSANNFAVQCVDGIQSTSTGPDMVERGLMLGTALAPEIGYDNAAKIAKTALKNNTTLKHEALKTKLINEKDYNRIVDPKKMIYPA